jgi:hypothetical protein
MHPVLRDDCPRRSDAKVDDSCQPILLGANTPLGTHDHCLVRCTRGYYAVDSTIPPADDRDMRINSVLDTTAVTQGNDPFFYRET